MGSRTVSEHWLLERYRRFGDRTAREELVRRLSPLVTGTARGFRSGGDVDDLEQAAAFGLAKAIERYDPAYGVPLRTYAISTMRGEVRRFLREPVLLELA